MSYILGEHLYASNTHTGLSLTERWHTQSLYFYHLQDTFEVTKPDVYLFSNNLRLNSLIAAAD
jgi:hypothetical protein